MQHGLRAVPHPFIFMRLPCRPPGQTVFFIPADIIANLYRYLQAALQAWKQALGRKLSAYLLGAGTGLTSAALTLQLCSF
ncbi:hypothetical protein HFN20_01975 [Paenibacillus dendritiformis]|uniref:hypothetical protein n=1 Tax=Paenibacillus dendritiformis TaxID=130049 RepID=UPI00143DBEBE|nr:hypothetical protein [Paenibacillus dendritiformis]NKI20014.1 hypothetical protein [Paenibacillus dendritiformis]NRG00674.1 hypothetical protein [Paenibacillus dendritiformis]